MVGIKQQNTGTKQNVLNDKEIPFSKNELKFTPQQGNPEGKNCLPVEDFVEKAGD